MANLYTGKTIKIGTVNDDILKSDIPEAILMGGLGNDSYFASYMTPFSVIEAIGGGIDTVNYDTTGGSQYSLVDNVENLNIVDYNFFLMGPSEDNHPIVINGNSDNNIIKINAPLDSPFNSDFRIYGGAGNDTITGGFGNDGLIGGFGKDSLAGGGGDDHYVIEDLSAYGDLSIDTVIENANNGSADLYYNGGLDTIHSEVSIDLSKACGVVGAATNNVENLELYIYDQQNPNEFRGNIALNINGTGNDLNNVIIGNIGKNIISGGKGNDILYGDGYVGDPNQGFDLFYDQGDEAREAADGQLIYPLLSSSPLGIGQETYSVVPLYQGDNDTIDGGDSNDVLIGGGGIDTLIGGLGDDLFFVDELDKPVLELAAGGNDTVIYVGQALYNGYSEFRYNYTLADNVENLVSMATIDDTIQNQSALTTAFLTGNASDNRITGNEFDDTLKGLAGNDALNGGEGKDTLIGGIGNDTYVVDNLGDKVIENANEGIDTVISSIAAYTLGANVENLQLVGNAYSGTGNDLNNILTGNEYGNILRGGKGNDILDGGQGEDVLIGGIGDDIYYADSFSDQAVELKNGGTDTVIASDDYLMGLNIENLKMGAFDVEGRRDFIAVGNALANNITGNDGNNEIIGGKGGDIMAGGKGDDRYEVDSYSDKVVENLNEGIDTVVSFKNIVLDAIPTSATQSSLVWGAGYANVENVILMTGADNATGNALNNKITGNEGDNILDGGNGNDALYGGSGSDILKGGIGNDALDGGRGADTMIGGAGDDIYYLDNIDDTVFEKAGEGIDSLLVSESAGDIDLNVFTPITGTATVDFRNIDNVTMLGAGNVIGNGLNNIIDVHNNNAVNIITGSAGDDVYIVDGYNQDSIYDAVVEGNVITDGKDDGIDTVKSYGDFTLNGNTLLESQQENLILMTGQTGTGNAAANIITGNDEDNTLDGGVNLSLYIGPNDNGYVPGNSPITGDNKADKLIGGKGDDTYFIRDLALDVVIENVNEGYDAVNYVFENYKSTAVSINVAANIESVDISHSIGLINITGNNLGNDLFGNDDVNVITGGILDDNLLGEDGNDTLIGGAGNDHLLGGAGNDNMTGGLGDDWYVIDAFNSAGTADRVTEKANEGNDTIELVDFIGTIDMTNSSTVPSNAFDLRQVENVLVTRSLDDVSVAVTGNTLNNQMKDDSESIVTFNGGSGNDHFIFGSFEETPYGIFPSFNKLTTDSVNGGDGIDVLDAYLQNTTSTPTITNVEQINFWLGGAGLIIDTEMVEADNTIDATGINATTNPGLKTTIGLFNTSELDLIENSPFHNNVSLNNLADAITVELRGRSDVTMTRAIATGVENQNLLLNGFDGSLALAGVEKLNVTVNGEASVIDLLDVTALQANGVTVTGDGDLEISNLFDAGAQITRDEVTGDILSTTGTGSLVLQDFTGGVKVAQAIDGVTQHITQNITLNNSVTGLFTDAEQLNLFSDITGNGSLGSTVDMNNVITASVTVGHLESGDADLMLMNLRVGVDASAFTGSLFAVADSNSNPVNIIGGQGDDTLIASDPGGMLAGGVGHDWLVGGDGSDGFLFTSILSSDSDRVGDFGGEDTILLGGEAAQGVVFEGEFLSISDFFSGTLEDYAANATNQHIIYDQSLGNLYYDADGTAGGEVVIVNVGINTTLAASNISSYAPA